MLHSLQAFNSYAPTPLSALRTQHSPTLPPSSTPTQPSQAPTISSSPAGASSAHSAGNIDPSLYSYGPASSITYQNGTHSAAHQGLGAGGMQTEQGQSMPSSRGSSVSVNGKPANVPPVGRVRCYWALLSENLKFLFLDPVLSTHMSEQASALIGKHLLDYVHPEDKDKAVEDLQRVVRSKTLHGSVTRLRYRRLTNIRSVLGAEKLEPVPEASLFCLDAEYLICDLVINCVGDNLVLCFFHAIVDKKPLEDNDEHEKTEWSNWCGAPSALSVVEYAADMYTALIPNSQYTNHHPQRVFQILKSEGRGIVFTWPLNGYEVLEFGGIARDVNIGGAGVVGEARTSCTRRYKANWRGTLSGVPAEVESVYIPYGSIIFACHRAQFPQQIEPHSLLRANYYGPAPYVATGAAQNTGYNPHSPASATTPGGYGPTYSPHAYSHTQYPASYTSDQQHQHQSGQHGGWPGTTIPPSPPLSNSQPTPMSSIPPQSYQQSMLPQQHASRSSPPSANYVYPRPPSPNPSPPPSHAVASSSDPSSAPAASQPKRPTRPPTGVQACVQCGNTTSPEWRKGPSGNKDLCNACGLRYSRTKAKEEGGERVKRGKRKGKGQGGDGDRDGEGDGEGKRGRKKRRTTEGDGDGDEDMSPEQQPPSPLPLPLPTAHIPQPAALTAPHLAGVGLGVGVGVGLGVGMGMSVGGWPHYPHLHHVHPHPVPHQNQHAQGMQGVQVQMVREPQGLDQPLLRKLPSMEDMFLLPTGLV